jgi:starvation-inducible DNA-binding protein
MTDTNFAESTRRDTAEILQRRLIELLALSLTVKQAHWHVTGRTFKQVHEQLDEIIVDVRAWSDAVAERSIALGVPIDGRPAAVAGNRLGEFPSGFLADDKVVALIADELAAVVDAARAELDRLGELDPVTQDLVIGVLAGMEKHVWMLRAQLA